MRRYLTGSLVVHFILSFGVWWSLLQRMPTPQVLSEPLWVEVDTVAASMPLKVKKPKPKEPLLKNQIVEQAEQAVNQEVPTDSRFLSQNNQTVKKQTRSKTAGEFQNRQKKAQWLQPKSRWLNEDGWKLKSEAEQQMMGQAELENKQKGSATLDYVAEIDEGLETLLSTKEFVYYTFFRRMRQQLNQFWTPKVRESVSTLYRKGRRLASNGAMVTRTVLTLSPEGYVLKVQVIGNSGIHELDKAAVEALSQASPFRNPPKGMIDPDGNIKIRWDFVIEG